MQPILYFNNKLKEFLSIKDQNSLSLVTIFITSLVYYLSYSSYGYSESDWGGILIAAERFIKGDIFYKDISIVYTPGIYLYTALAFKILGIKLSSATIAWSLIRAVNCILFYILSSKFFHKKGALLLTFFLWLIPGPLHKSFLVFFCLLHLIILLSLLNTNKHSYYFFSGLVAGLSFIFRLDLLPLFIIMLVITDTLKLRGTIKKSSFNAQLQTIIINYSLFLIGTLISILPIILYLYYNSSLFISVQQTLSFLGSAKSRMFLLPPLGNILSWEFWDFVKYSVIAIPVGIIILFILKFISDLSSGRTNNENNKLLILFFYGLFSIHQVLRWPWAGRLFQILPPFLIIDLYLVIDRIHHRHKSVFPGYYFFYDSIITATNTLLILMIIGSLAMTDMYTNGSVLIRLTNRTLVSTPKAKFYTTNENAKEIEKIIDIIESNTKKGEFIYIVQYYPMYYFITERRNATKYYFLEAYANSTDKQYDVIDSLENNNVRFIISGPNHPETPEPVVLNNYLNKNFKVVERVGKKIFYLKR